MKAHGNMMWDTLVISKNVIIFVLCLQRIFSGCVAAETQLTLHGEDFGVVGDGVTDDGPAIRKAIDAAIHSGPGTTLLFKPGIYRLAYAKDYKYHIFLNGVKNITIDFQGSELISTINNLLLGIYNCKNVTVRNFSLDHDPLPFTQGRVIGVDKLNGAVMVRIDDEYSLPPDYKDARGNRWLALIDPVKRQRKQGTVDHMFYESVHVTDKNARLVRIKFQQSALGFVKQVKVNDRLFVIIPWTQEVISGWVSPPPGFGNIYITQSSNCTIENGTVYSAVTAMVFSIYNNDGIIRLVNNSIRFKPNTDRVITTYRDGMHVKDNRVGPYIENCFFEGLMDDSINISSNTAMATQIYSDKEFSLSEADFAKGDKILVYDPVKGCIIGETYVVAVKGHRVKLAEPVSGVIVGHKRQADIRSTHFYNMSRSNMNYVVKKCTFLYQRRHALRACAVNGIIENNKIDGVGGSAFSLTNEMGRFYEGPFSQNLVIRNNLIKETWSPSICIGMEVLDAGKTDSLCRNILLENNIIYAKYKEGINIHVAKNVAMHNNWIILDETRKNNFSPIVIGQNVCNFEIDRLVVTNLWEIVRHLVNNKSLNEPSGLKASINP